MTYLGISYILVQKRQLNLLTQTVQQLGTFFIHSSAVCEIRTISGLQLLKSDINLGSDSSPAWCRCCTLLRLQKWWCSSVRALPRCRRREAGRRARWLSGFGCRSWRAQPRAVLNISFTSHQPSHAQCHEYPHHVTRHNLNGHISITALEARKLTEWIWKVKLDEWFQSSMNILIIFWRSTSTY